MLKKIQDAIMHLARRSDQQDQVILNSAFVNVGNIYASLSSVDHQILFGRRGTGKTHVLRYFMNEKNQCGDFVVYIDMRNLGSETSVYNDAGISLAERAKKVLLDVFHAIYNEILDVSFVNGDVDENIFNSLDNLFRQLSTITVVESKTIENERTSEENDIFEVGTGLSIDPFASASLKAEQSRSVKIKEQYSERNEVKVVFSGLAAAFNKVSEKLPVSRIWILLDEWVAIPQDIQPILADLIRRTLLTCRKVSVKVGAIEVGSKFISRQGSDGDHLGFELGADIQADISLDDFMVFGNDQVKAEHFFGELFRKHINAIDHEVRLSDVDQFISTCFTQRNAFSELVRAAEGVPRDAINILRYASAKANGEKYSIPSIRHAAKMWYDRDKSSNITGKDKLLLQWIIDNVIKGKKARGFLLDQNFYGRRQDISSLVNSRVLHIIKRGVSAKDNPGSRYDVYSIDYGCYVDLLTTNLAPDELDLTIEYQISVPHDDYRSLRRAILNLKEFDSFYNEQKLSLG